MKRNVGVIVSAIVLVTLVAVPGRAMVARVDSSATVTMPAARNVPRGPGVLGGAESRLECSWSVDTVVAAQPTGFSSMSGDDLTALYIGFSEQPGRQAVVMHIVDNEKLWCDDALAVSSEPSNTTGISWDFGDRAVIVVEASTDISGGLADAASTGWLRNFSDRNAGSRPAKSLIVATLDLATGEPTAATFLTARQQRSFQPADVVLSSFGFEGGGYRVEILSIEPPRRADGSTLGCDPDVFPYRATYVFRPDFSAPVVAAAPSCS